MTDQQRPESRSVGRPTDYTIDRAIEICARLATGEALTAICRDESMPNVATVYRWIESHDEFRDMYARSREDQADTLADEILEIADDGRNDWMMRATAEDGKEAGMVLNAEHIQRSRLRVDARKWIAAKLKPKKYGEKIAQEITGKDGGPVATRDDTPGLGAVKSALAGMLARTQDAPDDGEGQ